MAWHKAGDWGNVSVNELAELMHEVAYGIDQRLVLLGGSAAKWYVAPGTVGTPMKALPAAADFVGLVPNLYYVYSGSPYAPTISKRGQIANVVRAIEQVRALVAAHTWCKTATGAETWTYETMIEDIGLGDFDEVDIEGIGYLKLAPPRITDGATWLRLKGILDRCRYVRRPPIYLDGTLTERDYNEKTDDIYAATDFNWPTQSWDEMVAHADEGLSETVTLSDTMLVPALVGCTPRDLYRPMPEWYSFQDDYSEYIWLPHDGAYDHDHDWFYQRSLLTSVLPIRWRFMRFDGGSYPWRTSPVGNWEYLTDGEGDEEWCIHNVETNIAHTIQSAPPGGTYTPSVRSEERTLVQFSGKSLHPITKILMEFFVFPSSEMAGPIQVTGNYGIDILCEPGDVSYVVECDLEGHLDLERAEPDGDFTLDIELACVTPAGYPFTNDPDFVAGLPETLFPDRSVATVAVKFKSCRVYGTQTFDIGDELTYG